MLQRTPRKLLAPCIVLFVVGSLSACSKRSTDCHWNADCESSAGSGNTAGTAGGGAASTAAGSTSVGGDGGSGTGGTTTTACSRNPGDANACPVTTKYGVFVSSDGSDDTGAGTEEKPFASLAKALAVAAVPKNNTTRNVYVCSTAGTFTLTETLNIGTTLDGVSIYGGFDCSDKTTWTYEKDPSHRSRSAFVSEVPLAVKLDGLEDTTVRIENLSITAANATVPGDSSIAMLVVNSPYVTLSNDELIAQKGATGSNGAPAEGKAADGTPGNSGTDACPSTIISSDVVFIPGAAPVVTQCNGVETSKGARGGTGAIDNHQLLNPPVTTLTVGGTGENGTPEPSANGNLWGYGGVGEQSPISPCANGKDGTNGLSGANVETATSPGTLTSLGYGTRNGMNGKDGAPGQGGGGGGGAKAPTACSYSVVAPLPGASGGSGGSGGCGGKGGGGGQGGGASLALALLNSPITLINCALTAHDAGQGGNGGSGQSGGYGGTYGNGGGAPSSGLKACRGGSGGNGGSGAAGGGGAGGDSAAIGYVGDPPTVGTDTTLTVTPTTGATGGMDGNGTTTASGAQGKVQTKLPLKS